jgi:hypothetical protein
MRDAVRLLIVVALVAAGAISAQAQNRDAAESSEHLIKAGYVYNFAKLVEWPAGIARSGHPIVVGVLANDAFAAVLERVVAGKQIENRPFEVRRLKSRDFRACGCQILFIAAAEAARVDDILQFQNSSSVLTIAEAPDFASRGGVIALVLEDSKVRFIVNVDAAAQASLNISSRLLTLAKVVHTSR